MINFFEISAKKQFLIFSDLPGYGFSATGRQKRQYWQGAIAQYIERQSVDKLLFLVDSRRKLEEEDIELLHWIAKYCNIFIVLTKIDKLGANAKKSASQNLKKTLQAEDISVEGVYAVSSLKGTGINELKKLLLPEDWATLDDT